MHTIDQCSATRGMALTGANGCAERASKCQLIYIAKWLVIMICSRKYLRAKMKNLMGFGYSLNPFSIWQQDSLIVS